MPEAPQVETRTETRTCINADCGAEFEAQIIGIGPASLGPKRCPDCVSEEEAEERMAAISTRPSLSPEAELERIGVNVRKHLVVDLVGMGDGKAVKYAESFIHDVLSADRFTFVKGLYLSGETGVGKTQLAVATIRDILERGYQDPIVFDRARSLITTVQDRYGHGSVDEVIEKRRKAGVWVLDDIGTEKPTPDAFRILEDIIDRREGHPTILTSNLTPRELADHWAPQDVAGRFESRIGPQNFRYVSMVGADRRRSVA